MRRRLLATAWILGLAASALAGCRAGLQPIEIGGLFPLSDMQAPLARQEMAGVQIAGELVNDGGGVAGRPVEMLVRDLTQREDAEARVADLAGQGVSAIVGAYSSELSMPASEAAAARHLVYWEAGAVADQVTGRGLPLVFRVGATGLNLGSMSAQFAAEVIAPRLHRSVGQLRLAVVQESDQYGTSVGGAAAGAAAAAGMPVVATITYDAWSPRWPAVFDRLRAARPDIIVLASYIPDGVDFRRFMLTSGLHVDALIGSTMAECGPDFGEMLGADAIGVFASDRPTSGFNPAVLDATGRSAYDRFAAAWRARFRAAPTEEGLAGFSAGWALFRYVLPEAARRGNLTAESIARAARELELPPGTLPNGAGVEFAQSPEKLGQNLLASSVIWQWQAVDKSVTVYPPAFATGQPILIPLPR